MIYKSDLYDITAALVLIRNNIREKANPQILSQLIIVLQEKENVEENQIRKAVSSIKELDREPWYFTHHNNVYVNHQILKEDQLYDLFIKLFQNLIYELDREQFEKAYDLADSFHCLPEIIANNSFTIPRSFWKTFVKDYRSKWDNDFLRVEEKIFKKHIPRGAICNKRTKKASP